MQEHCWCAVNLAHTFIKAILKHQLGSIWLIFYQLVHLTWSAFSLFILSKLFHVMVTCLRKAIVSKRESSSFFRSCLHFLKCSIIFLYAMRLQHIQPSKLVLTNYVFWNLSVILWDGRRLPFQILLFYIRSYNIWTGVWSITLLTELFQLLFLIS